MLEGVIGPVPVYAQMHDYAAAHACVPRRDFYTRAEIMVPALLEAYTSLGIEVASLF